MESWLIIISPVIGGAAAIVAAIIATQGSRSREAIERLSEALTALAKAFEVSEARKALTMVEVHETRDMIRDLVSRYSPSNRPESKADK